MKYFIIIILSFSLHNSCINKKKEQVILNHDKVDFVKHNNTDSTALILNDTVNIDKFSIRNNKIFLSKKVFNSVWKKADSIRTITPDCGYLTEVNSVVTEHYFKGIKFLLYDEYAELVSINFLDENIKLVYSEIILSNKTKLEDIKKTFPNSYILREELTSNHNTINIRIRLLLGRDIDQYIILDFEKEKLISFEIWSPC